MSKFVFILVVNLVLANNAFAQKSVVVDFNVGLNKSVGHDILKSKRYPNINIQYYQRKEYKNPYLNFTGNILYRLGNDCLLGIRSGVYIYIMEEYVSIAKRTTISVPLEITGRYKVFDIRNNSLGINLEAGFNFFNVYDRIERYNNGKLLGASAFYLIRKKHLIKFGVEKQIDNVSMYVYKINPYSPIQIFNYKINRLSFALSYGTRL